MPDGMVAIATVSRRKPAPPAGGLSAAAQAHGLTPRAFGILACAVSTPGLSATDVCRRLNLPKCAVSYAMGRLTGQGLARQETDMADLRRIHIFPTEAGQALLRRIVASVAVRTSATVAMAAPMASIVPVPETAAALMAA